jgi:hypothetical protein
MNTDFDRSCNRLMSSHSLENRIIGQGLRTAYNRANGNLAMSLLQMDMRQIYRLVIALKHAHCSTVYDIARYIQDNRLSLLNATYLKDEHSDVENSLGIVGKEYGSRSQAVYDMTTLLLAYRREIARRGLKGILQYANVWE